MTNAFPDGWNKAVIFVPHPDDVEWGMAPAVSQWTRNGKTVEYVIATRGEAGIEGMSPDEAGPLREQEQLRAAAHVGVQVVEFLGFPDSLLVNDEALRAAVAEQLAARAPDVVITCYTGPNYSEEIPNQSDHIEFGNAVHDVVAQAEHRPEFVFESGPGGTHCVDVEAEDVQRAVASLAEHKVYLEVLDPDKPVVDQAREVVERLVTADEGLLRVDFIAK
ncbi:PIG-L family deacetylase [Tessaracoccus sp. OS52]|uniref:PIG-L deacetylase family protein n=1 Tax=Tessaracoccus sp. OS52 TaxID=2886691 RepID=UPI001D0F8E22|nr:PIG-L family deacetylase [Tessaracoccus sp. OS52]MCC2593560.1 PIG-L family deacetylase [Tessaracoccus sp. OS52]